MKYKELQRGQTFKNYKYLCTFLDETVKKGDSKKAQMKEWKRFFSFHKEGHRIIIDKIYDVPQEKEDGRKNNGKNPNSHVGKSKYNADYLECLINIYIDKARDYVMEKEQYMLITGNKLDQATGFTADSYGLVQNNPEYKTAYNLLYSRRSSLRDSQLKQLQEKEMIEYEKTIIVYNGFYEVEATMEEKNEWEESIKYVTTQVYNHRTDMNNLFGKMCFWFTTFYASVQENFIEKMNHIFEQRQEDKVICNVYTGYKISMNLRKLQAEGYGLIDCSLSRKNINEMFFEAMEITLDKQWRKKKEKYKKMYPGWNDHMKKMIKELLTMDVAPVYDRILGKDYFTKDQPYDDIVRCMLENNPEDDELDELFG